ncbi:hypothetical protein ACE1N8_00110 [Streptomyces sp. DSM 116494]|uniref:hypothetical protein n=1 Tax=Streptomyces okerensis TaxID=3344655 RepID=UPI00388FC7CE
MTEAIRMEQLRELVKQELVRKTTGSTLPGVCQRLGMSLPDETGHLNGYSKGQYVRERLESVGDRELPDLARRVVAQLGSDELEAVLARMGPRGASGEFRNLIFAGIGPKPRIVYPDAVGNHLRLEENAEFWLLYDQPLTFEGLTWGHLLDWWRSTEPAVSGLDGVRASSHLYRRLKQSLDEKSPPEHTFFAAYARRLAGPGGTDLPAMLPQVHLHYDPYTKAMRGGRPGRLTRERMDFLMLLPNGVRVVLEVDGVHHYSEDGRPSPRVYADMVREDRALRLAGYEVYRFGGYELMQAGAETLVDRFFDEFFAGFN